MSTTPICSNGKCVICMDGGSPGTGAGATDGTKGTCPGDNDFCCADGSCAASGACPSLKYYYTITKYT